MSASSSISLGSAEGQAFVDQFKAKYAKMKWLNCSICHVPYKDPYLISLSGCMHAFCRDCLANTMDMKSVENSCFVCKAKYQRSDLRHDSERDSTICELWKAFAAKKCVEIENPYQDVHIEHPQWEQHQVQHYGYNPNYQAPEAIRSTGKFKAVNKVLDSIKVEKDIFIINCKVHKKTKSKCSIINAIDCELKAIESPKDISLRDTTFSEIAGTFYSSVTCRQTALNTAAPQGHSIDATRDIKLENIYLTGRVKSELGVVEAVNCLLDKVDASQGIKLDLCNATTVLCRSGKIEAAGTAEKKSQFDSLGAADIIKISHSSVAGDVASCSTVEANDCVVLGEVTSNESLFLNRSQVGTATIDTKIAGLPTLYLDAASKIEGDLIVKMEEEKVDFRELKLNFNERGFKISITMGDFQYKRDREDNISIKCSSYPFSSREKQILCGVLGFIYPVQISSEGYITDAEEKNIYINGEKLEADRPLSSTHYVPVALPSCTLTIVGEGEIGGSIKFEGCEGTVVRQ